MNIQRMHSEIKLRYNKLNSNHKPDLPTAFIDDFIDNAHDEFLHICYSGRNDRRFRMGFETTQQRIDLISTLVIPEEDIATTLFKTNIYKINLANLSKTYRHLVKLSVTTSCGKIECIVVRHEDLDSNLRNENTKPSSIWKRCIAVEASDSNGNQCIYLYTGGQYTITGATVSYIMAPRKVFYGGYNTLEYTLGDLTAPSSVTAPINSLLPLVSHNYIVDLTVQLIERSLEDVNGIQISEDKISRTL